MDIIPHKYRINHLVDGRLPDFRSMVNALHGQAKNFGHEDELYKKFFVATKKIKVFKLATDTSGCYRYIINLIIPKGTKFHIGCTMGGGECCRYKCRAEKVFVHSIVDKWTGKEVKIAYSFMKSRRTDKHLKYEVGKLIDLTKEFSHEYAICAEGIHFFLDIKSAYYYR